MIHNETVNVWTHLIGALIFVFLVRYTYTQYEPSEFYYQVLMHNQTARTSSLTDLGISYDKFFEMKRELTEQSLAPFQNVINYMEDFKTEIISML